MRRHPQTSDGFSIYLSNYSIDRVVISSDCLFLCVNSDRVNPDQLFLNNVRNLEEPIEKPSKPLVTLVEACSQEASLHIKLLVTNFRK